ncbi:MAG TPA: hypothetical protein IGS53_13025, partial [Leptolyngbyaceae cyanobacterium M33_DOE_097]|nr:hypothetical protein [Leptolyngbyaceae cyanobacterium M33_DOE_097]
MSNLISKLSLGFSAFFKGLRVKQLVAVLLGGFLLAFSTACSSATPRASAPNRSANQVYSRPADQQVKYSTDKAKADSAGTYNLGEQSRELYAPIQKPTDGMNTYNDDLKYESGRPQATAEKLIKNSKENLKNRAENPQELIENARNDNPLGEKARESYENIKGGANAVKRGATEGVREGTSNIKANAKQLSKEAPRVVDKAQQNASNSQYENNSHKNIHFEHLSMAGIPILPFIKLSAQAFRGSDFSTNVS